MQKVSCLDVQIRVEELKLSKIAVGLGDLVGPCGCKYYPRGMATGSTNGGCSMSAFSGGYTDMMLRALSPFAPYL